MNHPFAYKGITFYQAGFSNGARFTTDINGQKNPVVLQDQGQSYYQAPGTDLYLVASLSGSSPQNPGVLYQVYKGTGYRSHPNRTAYIRANDRCAREI